MSDPSPPAPRAWWSGTLAAFSACDQASIIERLALRLVETHRLNRPTQLQAWRRQVEILAVASADLPSDWRLLLEYPLLRLGRRLDAVLITDRVVVVLEFKIGAAAFDNAARMQVEDYALDLQDFHAGSRNVPIVPVLVSSEATAPQPRWPLFWHGVSSVFEASALSLKALLEGIVERVPDRNVDTAGWECAVSAGSNNR